MKLNRSIPICLFTLICSLQAQAQNSDGDSIFFSPDIHIVNITFWQPNYWDSLVANYPLDVLMAGNVNFDGTQYDSCGLQLKGNSSYNSYPGVKKSIKIAFDEYWTSQKCDGLKTLNLNNGFKDPTMLREKIDLDFLYEHNIPAPRATFAKVYINGTYWGFYSLVEQVNKTFLNDRFGNKNGNLFKGDPNGTLQWVGPMDTSYYHKYELHTNETINDWSDLVHLIDKVNNTPSANFYDTLETLLNTDANIQAWAANILFSNLDSYQGSGHNYYIYHNTSTGKFEWITWDVNEAFGNFNLGMNINQIENLDLFYIPNPQNARPLTQKMQQNATYRQQYSDAICLFIQNDFSNAELDPKIDSLANRIRNDYYADPNKMFSNTQFETNLTNNQGNSPGLKSFIQTRRTFLINQLASLGCATGIADFPSSRPGLTIYPNPLSNGSTLTISASEGSRIEIFDYLGSIVFKTLVPSDGSISINSKTIAQGIYMIRVSLNGEIIGSHKLVVE